MDALAEQADLGELLCPGETRSNSSVDLHQPLSETPGAFSSCQQGQAENLQQSQDAENGLQAVTSPPEGAAAARVDETEARPDFQSSGALPLDIAARRSLLLGRTKQKHVCHVCGRECPSKHKLKRHLSTHSEDRPFNCHICGKSFKWTEYLAKHIRHQHAGVNTSEAIQMSVSAASQQTATDLPQQSSREECGTSMDSTVAMETSDVAMETSDVAMDTSSLDPALDASASATLSEPMLNESAAFAEGLQPQQDNPVSTSAATSTTTIQSLQEAGLVQQPLPTQTQQPPGQELIPIPTAVPPPEPPQEITPPPQATPTSDILTQLGIPLPDNTQPLSHHPELHSGSETGNGIMTQAYAHPIPSSADFSQHNLPPYPVELQYTQSGTDMSGMLPTMPPNLPPPPQEDYGIEMHPACAYGMVQDANGFHNTLQAATHMQDTQSGGIVLDAAAFQPAQETPPTTEMPPPPPPVTIVQEDTEDEITLPAKRPRKETVSIGIQCEVGHETIAALREEEQARGVYAQTDLEIDASAIHIADNGEILLSGEGYGDGSENPNADSDKLVQKYPCEADSCNKAYIHRKDLIRHMKIRHGISPQKLEPVAMETPDKPYACPVGGCGRSYFHTKDLRRHQRQCHTVTMGMVDSYSSDTAEGEGKTMLRFPCDFPGCTRSYMHKKDLVRHKRLYHKDASTKPSVPVPMRYTEAELKKIRQEEKTERVDGDEKPEKSRLDSIGSTISTSCPEEPPNSATLTDTDHEMPDPPDLTSFGMSPLEPSFRGADVLLSAAEIQSRRVTHTSELPITSTSAPMPQPEMPNVSVAAANVLTHQPVPQLGQMLTESQLTSPSLVPTQHQPVPEMTYPSSTSNISYNVGTFSGNTVYSFAKQPHTSAVQHQQVEDPDTAQYDPTTVLNALSTSNSSTLQPQSLQSVVNSLQLFSSTQGTNELTQGSF